MLFLFAASFAVVGAIVAEARLAAFGAAAICAVVAVVGIPLLVHAFSSFTGDEQVLETGLPGKATIARIEPTGWRYNRTYPIVRFGLEVELADGVYPAEIRQAVDPVRLERLAPGSVVAVRVDPANRARVVIDWREAPPPSAG